MTKILIISGHGLRYLKYDMNTRKTMKAYDISLINMMKGTPSELLVGFVDIPEINPFRWSMCRTIWFFFNLQSAMLVSIQTIRRWGQEASTVLESEVHQYRAHVLHWGHGLWGGDNGDITSPVTGWYKLDPYNRSWLNEWTTCRVREF
jgi:hypothetical protein